MHISSARLRLTANFLDFGFGKQRTQERVHDYTRRVAGCHYFLSAAENRHQVYLTAEGDRVKPHDYIVLKDEQGETRYQVEEIQHYGDNPMLWTALLSQC
jgi:hypothetical protein